MSKIIIIGALPMSLLNFRGELLKSCVEKGAEVIAMASGATEDEIAKIELLGVKYIDYPVQRNGLNPVKDIQSYFALKRIFKNEKPDIILAYTIKPVIWGAFAARTLKHTQFHALITGLGFAFQRAGVVKNILVRIISFLYRIALSNAATVIFQNNDNRQVFLDERLTTADKCHLVNGSGVDVQHFKYKNINLEEQRFLLIARLLKDKGIAEYIQAAEEVKKTYPEAIFEILGPEDPSPNGFPMHEIQKYHDLGIISYRGETANVIPYIEACQIYVLPSYHEGLPRTVIEAMSIGRPILTTFAPGCKDTVIESENGFLVPVRNSKALADKMIWFLEHREKWKNMSIRSRELAEEKFDVHEVNKNIFQIIGLKG